MEDDLSDCGAQDRIRINVNEFHEVRYWTEKFAISKAELRTAVTAVGVSMQAVAQHLGKPASNFTS